MTISEIVAKLQELAAQYPDKIVFSTSYSFEDQLITHLIRENQLPIRIFTLDTGRMFPETYKVMHETNKSYKANVQVFFPDARAVENLVNEKGLFSFYNSVEDRKECCFVRKVLPLKRALAGAECWITGIRAEHSPNRQNMTAWEWDAENGLHKFHPLLHWTSAEVEDYVRAHHIPYNRLHDQNFPSIGCQPCTRAVAVGEDMRAGRWWWEDTSKKECGLHAK
jgi:phosphoadenosine phosphosulfate reductase